MTSIAIAGGSYDTAAESFVGGNRTCATSYDALTRELCDYAAMAGDDSTSTDFGTAYDAAAREAVDLHADLADAFGTLAVLTARSVDNHRAANLASVIDRSPPRPDDSLRERPVDVSTRRPPSCVGGDDDEHLPHFWSLVVDHLQGFAWPNADTDRLRSAADTWRGAAADLRVLPRYCDVAAGMLETQRAPEIPSALDAVDDLRVGIEDLATMCSDLGRACDDYADDVETHRDIIKGILRDLAVEAGVTMTAGAVVGFFTVGAGAAAGAAMAATRAVAAARKVISALRALRAAARLRAVDRLTGVVERVAPLRSVLARFKAAKHVDDVADVRHLDDLEDLEDWRELPPKIEGRWHTVDYRKGTTTSMEHVKRAHWPDSTIPAKSHFSDDITEARLMDYVDEAVRRGDIDPADPGTIDCDLGRVIGTDKVGLLTNTIRVHIRDGVIHSAYPVRQG